MMDLVLYSLMASFTAVILSSKDVRAPSKARMCCDTALPQAWRREVAQLIT